MDRFVMSCALLLHIAADFKKRISMVISFSISSNYWPMSNNWLSTSLIHIDKFF
jgi:hypothetical protein